MIQKMNFPYAVIFAYSWGFISNGQYSFRGWMYMVYRKGKIGLSSGNVQGLENCKDC